MHTTLLYKYKAGFDSKMLSAVFGQPGKKSQGSIFTPPVRHLEVIRALQLAYQQKTSPDSKIKLVSLLKQHKMASGNAYRWDLVGGILNFESKFG